MATPVKPTADILAAMIAELPPVKHKRPIQTATEFDAEIKALEQLDAGTGR